MVYKYAIDPWLHSAHKKVTNLITSGENILDVGCGNGTLSLMMAEKAGAIVTGIDIDNAMLRDAERVKAKKQIKSARFINLDATDLSEFADLEFHTGVISMALHQFSPVDRQKVLTEMMRVCRRIIILDYAWPMKHNFYWYLTRTIEWFAGREHFSNFKLYMQEGGLDSITPGIGLAIKERQITGGGTMDVLICEGVGEKHYLLSDSMRE